MTKHLLIGFFKKIGINLEYKEDYGIESYTIYTKTKNVKGYSGFYCSFIFEKGKFTHMVIAE